MKKEDLRAEASQRMIFMRMKPEIIRNFSSGKLMKTDLNGTLQPITQEEQKVISDWEEKTDCMVYYVLEEIFHEFQLLHLLHVSWKKENWEIDKKEIANREIMVCIQIWTIQSCLLTGIYQSDMEMGLLERHKKRETLVSLFVMSYVNRTVLNERHGNSRPL